MAGHTSSAGHAWRALGCVLAVTVGWSAPAHAGEARIDTVNVEQYGEQIEAKLLVYTASPGERNDLLVVLGDSYKPEEQGADDDQALVRDEAGVTPGRSCRRPDPEDPTLVLCDFDLSSPGSVLHSEGQARISLGDGDDRARLAGLGIDFGPPGADFDGGPGNDHLVGGDDGYNSFIGGPGDDFMGSAGFDEINEGDAANGSDTFVGEGLVS